MEDSKMNRLGFSTGEPWCEQLDTIESYGPEFAAGFYAGRMDRLRLGFVEHATKQQDEIRLATR